ncbi:hypothetical protein [Schleiferilactobacillus harbinensis]|uniref:Uncharacterized protein n=1 Tax=Schleiferilactobacillus harbinensis TaxID=304207 RepID=A0A5P8M5A3_9LACO|nr:hypothetical protein [Schleiferilactobacillus harbinensis]QFR23680.1 hypothetical protein D1010_09825 [Schleiferilactobacillus harbinensis]
MKKTKQSPLAHDASQGVASYVGFLNYLRLSELQKSLTAILDNESRDMSHWAAQEKAALAEMSATQTDISGLISSHRGGLKGVHGFIAERAEVGIRNARDLIADLDPGTAWLNNNGYADLMIGGRGVQMKFYQDLSREISQARNYPDLQMMIPRDHFSAIEAIMAGEKNVKMGDNSLRLLTITEIRSAVTRESEIRGLPYKQWLRPSVDDYAGVQVKTINGTLKNESASLHDTATAGIKAVRNDAKKARATAQQTARPSVTEGAKSAGVGAALQGGLGLAGFIYQKHRNGKEVWQFEADDWAAAGVKTGTESLKGGISGASIYGLTNVTKLAAPSAGAVVSGTFGLASATLQLRQGTIDADEFSDLVLLNAIEATGAAVGAVLGQTLIPVPVLGALIGSIAASAAMQMGAGIFADRENALVGEMKRHVDAAIGEISADAQVSLATLKAQFASLGRLQDSAFDLERNIQLRFDASIDLARAAGVSEKMIRHQISETDQYFLS